MPIEVCVLWFIFFWNIIFLTVTLKWFKDISFIHYNARNLSSNISEIKKNVLNKCYIRASANAIFDFETQTKGSYLHFEIPDYSLFYIDRSNKQGDCVTYINSMLNCNTVFENILYIACRMFWNWYSWDYFATWKEYNYQLLSSSTTIWHEIINRSYCI